MTPVGTSSYRDPRNPDTGSYLENCMSYPGNGILGWGPATASPMRTTPRLRRARYRPKATCRLGVRATLRNRRRKNPSEKKRTVKVVCARNSKTKVDAVKAPRALCTCARYGRRYKFPPIIDVSDRRRQFRPTAIDTTLVHGRSDRRVKMTGSGFALFINTFC